MLTSQLGSDDYCTAYFQLCTVVLIEHGLPTVYAMPLVFYRMFCFFFELGANSPLRRDAWLSVVLDKCCSSLLCLGFSLRGQPRAHGGCRFGWWAAYNKAGVLHMVCHSSVCSSLPMEIVCSAPSRVDLFFCHTMFIPSFWSDANVEKVS